MKRVRRVSIRSIAIAPISIAWLAVVISCGDEPTTVEVPPQQEIPITGDAVPAMGAYDQIISNLMKKYKVPGGAVGVVRDGKLIYARGFGYADVEHKTTVKPDALFRIASVSKTITATAVMKLVEEGKLKLDDRVAPIIADMAPAPGATVDPRWEQITIRQLLNHTAGWDRTKPGGFDPAFQSLVAAAAMKAPAPASSETIIRYMKGIPLDFNPGDKFVYSNFGYIILARVIERVSGMKYEDYVRLRVLTPVGANHTRLGKTRMSEALTGEVQYYEPGLGVTEPQVPSVFPGEGTAPIAYGGFYLDAADGSSAWVSSTVDLLRFVSGIDGRDNRPDILSAGLVSEMTSSGAPVCANDACYYGAGWFVRPIQGGEANWWHGGDMPGTTALLLRSYHNYSWVALFNANPTLGTGKFDGELDNALWNALAQVTSFPTNDLFSSFP